MNRFSGMSGMMRSLASTAVCLTLTALAGCGGGGGGSDTATISGKVTYNGAPVANGNLTLFSTSGSSYPVPLKSDGTFNVSGAPIGMQEVAIDPGSALPPPPAGSSGAPAAAAHVDIPPQYKDHKTSGLTWDIKAGKNTPKNFDLK